MKLLLDEIKDIDKVDYILIENQISPIANRMKTIQGMLAQYFIMKIGNNVNIFFISSQNKLKLFKQNKVEDVKKKKKDQNYSINKKDSIFYTIEILKNNIQLMNWLPLLSTKKKDDLSDCFLQCIWYLTFLNLIKININHTIENCNNS